MAYIFLAFVVLVFSCFVWPEYKKMKELRKKKEEEEFEYSRPPRITKIVTADGKEHYATVHQRMVVYYKTGQYYQTHVDFSQYWLDQTKEQAESILAGYMNQLQAAKDIEDSQTIVKVEDV